MPPRCGVTYSFTLLTVGPDPTQHIEALFEAGLHDVTAGMRDGTGFLGVDREAASLSSAVISAIRSCESAVAGIRVVRVEPEEFVTASAIAERTGRTRESIRLLFEGARGPGAFPGPIAWLNDRTKLWDWGEVATWFAERMGEDVSTHSELHTIGAMNALLRLRNSGVPRRQINLWWEALRVPESPARKRRMAARR